MAGETNKIKVKATAKLEKYPVGAKSEDIKAGKIKPDETITSEDILIDPTPNALRVLQNMGIRLSPEVKKIIDAKIQEEKKKLQLAEDIK